MNQLDLYESPADFHELASQGALFVCNHSGGKDSQAMYLLLRAFIPASQIVVVHAHLPEVEWDGIREHIAATTDVPYYEVRAGKTFFEMVEHRQMWPSPSTRQCTSDLKRGPIQKKVRAILKERGLSTVVNCMGLRADESPGRAKKARWAVNAGQSIAGRTWYEWLPIHHFSEAQVFETIRLAGQSPHWAYGAGMKRLSCSFCIMASDADLITAARLLPELAKRYIETEERLQHTFRMPVNGQKRWLRDLLGTEIY